MSVRHGNLHKRKISGGRKHPYRKMRRFERGSFPTETTLGEAKRKTSRRTGGNMKTRVLSDLYTTVSDPAKGETKKTKILRVVKNPANIDYDRRGVITKGTVIETEFGMARVTSRPGQDGVINSVLLPKKEA